MSENTQNVVIIFPDNVDRDPHDVSLEVCATNEIFLAKLLKRTLEGVLGIEGVSEDAIRTRDWFDDLVFYRGEHAGNVK